MLYALIGWDGPDALAVRRRVRAAHLERVRRLAAAGRVVLAGPMPAVDAPDPGEAGFEGSLIVAEFDSRDDALAWLRGDPYVTEGVFESYEVKPFLRVLP